MALYPNGRYMTRSTYKGYGVAPGLDANIKGLGDRMNRFLSLNKTASTPDGYGMKTPYPPLKAGSLSSLQRIATVAEGTSNLLQGGPMEGTGSITITGENMNLSLIVGLEGTSSITLTGENLVLALTIGLSGNGEWSLTGDTSSLSMIVPMEGLGSFTVTGVSDLRGLLSLSGEWTPFTELSPEGLANAVWNSLAASYNSSGTMGSALNAAGSGGIDTGALADAIAAAVLADPSLLTVGKFLGLK
jgi:hypothetical protein